MKYKLCALIFTILLLLPLAASAGNIDPDKDGSQYAYGENVGWINFEPSQGGGVTVTDSAVTGKAWGENIGWINLSPATGGVANDGVGNLSGYAWGENVGWINFSPTGAGVKIDPATGVFSGKAWGENIGWINFAPNGKPIKTSWRRFVTLVQPNGGEVIPSGSTYTVRWHASPDEVKFDLLYSLNNGTKWISIVNKTTGTSYNWTVPTPTSNETKCLVKVIGYDASAIKLSEDTSDAPFTIEVVKVTYPNGGEILESGKTSNITWQTNGTIKPVAKTEIYYTAGGGIWKLITTRNDNYGSYPWEVPWVSSKKCKVKVVLKDASGKVLGNDVSDKVFTIKPVPIPIP